MNLIKPKRLRPGDTVAIVSLSSGMLGDKEFIHKYYLARERLEGQYGLRVVAMPNALRGREYLDLHPEARAADFMDAFRDDSIRAVISSIGGDDTIRLLPYVDFDVLRAHPKIFTGFSDTTTNHFMLHKAGVISYYGPCVMCNFSEYVRINEYTDAMIRKTFFHPEPTLDIPPAPYWYDDEDERIWWKEENMNTSKPYHPDDRGYEVIQAGPPAEGELLGGCIDVFPEFIGTVLWPEREDWEGKLLMVETSEEDMPPEYLTWYLRGLAAQGIFDAVKGVLVGRPARRSRWEDYKAAYRRVIGLECGRPDLPILGNLNFGHADPIGVFPLGVRARMDTAARTLTLLESATE